MEVPTTWAEQEAACAALKAANPDVYPWGIDMTTDEGQAAFAYYIWNNGGDFTDAEGNWTLNSPENVEAIKFAILPVVILFMSIEKNLTSGLTAGGVKG